ncbi:hypothetical protein D3C76_1700030 [compost metagenome]
MRASELGEEAIAVVQFIDQGATLAADLTDPPLTAAVEQNQLVLIPTPLAGQSLKQPALPVAVALARGAA